MSLVTSLAAACAMAHAEAGGVYRCVNDGEVEYTDRPCAQATVVQIDTSRAGVVLAQAQLADRAEPLAAAPVVAGMSPKVVYETLGRPRAMAMQLDGIMPIERWSYRVAEGTLVVTFRHGRVASVATQ